ncbi:MAG: hypothetical protein HMLIMOIP_000702 [Candidatus Nitrosomirales archaeon]|jgi:hypothetical protein
MIEKLEDCTIALMLETDATTFVLIGNGKSN